jgi:hypothetical protein
VYAVFDRSCILTHHPYVQVIKLYPSSHRGYEKKYMALHGAADYGEANNALIHMLSIIENSPDEEIRRTYL